MIRAAPAIPLFGDAYLADTRHLSLEEHGAYLQLLMIAWRTPDCALPDDDARLARMLGVTAKKWAKLKPTIMAFWSLSEAGWQQKRLLKERRFVAKKSEQNRDAINARWEANRLKNNDTNDTNVVPDGYQNDTPPPPPKKEEEKKEEVRGGKPPKLYAFSGGTIRLKPSDLDRWRSTYHAVADIEAELSTLDAWFEGQPESKRKAWFHVTAGALNRKHQEILSAAKGEEADPMAVFMP